MTDHDRRDAEAQRLPDTQAAGGARRDASRAAKGGHGARPPLFNPSHWRALERGIEGLRRGRSVLVMLGEPEAGATAVLRELCAALPPRLQVVIGGADAATLQGVMAALAEALGAEGEGRALEAEIEARLNELADADQGVVYLLAPREPLTEEALVYLARLAAAGRRATRERLSDPQAKPLRGPVGAQVLLSAPNEAAPALAALGDRALRRAVEEAMRLEPFDVASLQAAFRHSAGGELSRGAARYALAACRDDYAALERVLGRAKPSVAPTDADAEAEAAERGAAAPIVSAGRIAAAAAAIGLAPPVGLNPRELDAADTPPANAEGCSLEEACAPAASRPATGAAAEAAPARADGTTLEALLAEGPAAHAAREDDEATKADERGSVGASSAAKARSAPAPAVSAPPEIAAQLATLDLLEDVDADPDLLRPGRAFGDLADEDDDLIEVGEEDVADAAADLGLWAAGDEDDSAMRAALDQAWAEGVHGAETEAALKSALEAVEGEPEASGVGGRIGKALGLKARRSASERLGLPRGRAPRTLGAAAALRRLAFVGVALLAAGLGGAALYGVFGGGAAKLDRAAKTAGGAIVTGDAAGTGEGAANPASAAAGPERVLYDRLAQGALGAAERAARAAAAAAAPTDDMARELRRFADDLFAAQGELDRARFSDELAVLGPEEAKRRLETRIEQAVSTAEIHMAAGRFSRPEGANAYETLLNVYPLASRDTRVRGALKALSAHYDAEAKAALAEGRYDAFHRSNRIADRIRARKPL